MTELEFYKTELERAKKGIEELSKALEESESREKELCILAENLKAENAELKAYILNCWHEEDLNNYSNYITNTKTEYREIVKKLRDIQSAK